MGTNKSNLSANAYLEKQKHNAIMYWVEERIPFLQPFYRNLIAELLTSNLFYLKKAQETQDNDSFVYLGIANTFVYTIQEIFALYSDDGGNQLTKGFCSYIEQIKNTTNSSKTNKHNNQ